MFWSKFCSSNNFWISLSNGPIVLSQLSVLLTFAFGDTLSLNPLGDIFSRLKSFLSVWQDPSFFKLLSLQIEVLVSSSLSSSRISSASLKLGERLQFEVSLLHSSIESLSLRKCLSKLFCFVDLGTCPLALVARNSDDGFCFGLLTNSKLAQLSPL